MTFKSALYSMVALLAFILFLQILIEVVDIEPKFKVIKGAVEVLK
jgi:hypothetical protein